jgi:hypothetical protein
VSTLNGQWLDIFRAGDYGEKGVFTTAQLAALVASYDPAKQEAPIVVGHPKIDAPAFGWVKKLRMDGDVLQGLLDDVDPDFDAAVQAKRYKKRSVAFVRNAVTGALKLRHVGWLGAMPPHVEGLRDAQFSAEEYDEIDFSDEPEGEEMDEQQVKKTVRDSIAEFFANLGGKKNESAISQAEIDAAVNRAVGAVESRFADQLKAEQTARAALETQLTEHRKTFADTSAASRVSALIGGLKASKRWIPAYDKMGVTALFAAMAAAPVEIEFADGDKKFRKDTVQTFADFLNGLAQIVPEGVKFSADHENAPTPKVPEVTGIDVDAASVAFNAQVEAYAREQKIEYNAAYTELTRQGKRPESGSASAGAV